mgnify:FL=1
MYGLDVVEVNLIDVRCVICTCLRRLNSVLLLCLFSLQSVAFLYRVLQFLVGSH